MAPPAHRGESAVCKPGLAACLLWGRRWLGLLHRCVALCTALTRQSIGSGGLGLLTLLAHRFGSPLSRRDRFAGIVATIGIVLVCSSLAVAPTNVRPRLAVVFVVVLGGMIIAGTLAGVGRSSQRSGIALGVATGVLYSMSDIATKGALEGLGLVLLPLVLTCSVLGFAALQVAFQRDAVLATAGLSSLINSLVPIGAGIVLFREVLPNGIAGWARGPGFILSITGGVLLTRSATNRSAPRVRRVDRPVSADEVATSLANPRPVMK